MQLTKYKEHIRLCIVDYVPTGVGAGARVLCVVLHACGASYLVCAIVLAWDRACDHACVSMRACDCARVQSNVRAIVHVCDHACVRSCNRAIMYACVRAIVCVCDRACV